MKQSVFKLNLISVALFSSCLVGVVQADENQEKITTLSDVTVTGVKKKIHRKENEVTGLGKLVKNVDSINKEQILGIRDLTRYDQGFLWLSKVAVLQRVIQFAVWIRTVLPWWLMVFRRSNPMMYFVHLVEVVRSMKLNMRIFALSKLVKERVLQNTVAAL